jgi:hypothetical protein
MAGIGERHRDATAHAAGAETGDGGTAMLSSSAKTFAQQTSAVVAVEIAETKAGQRAAVFA